MFVQHSFFFQLFGFFFLYKKKLFWFFIFWKKKFWVLELLILFFFSFLMKKSFIHIFSIIYNVLFFFLPKLYVMVILYKLYFLSSHFSSQPNKKVFHPSTFLPSQPNTYERELNFFYPSTFLSSLHFLSSHFFTPPTKWTIKKNKKVHI